MWLSDAAQSTPPGTSPPDSFTADATALIASLGPVATTIMTGIDQQKLLDFNMKLISMGKPPLTAEQLAALQSSASPQLSLGLGADTSALVKDALIGAAVLGGGFLLVKALTSRR